MATGEVLSEATICFRQHDAVQGAFALRGMADYFGNVRNSNLERLCGMAAQIFGVQHAALSFSMDAVSQVIASWGRDVRFRTYFSFCLPWQTRPDNNLLIHDARGSSIAARLAGVVWPVEPGFLARRVILMSDSCVITLKMFDELPRSPPSAIQLRLYDDVCDQIREAVIAICEIQKGRQPFAAANLDSLCAEIVGSMEDELLVDTDLKVICASLPLRKLLGDHLNGMSLADIVRPSMRESIELLARRTLRTGISPPNFELVHIGEDKSYAISMAPIFLAGPTRQTVLLVQRRDNCEQHTPSRLLEKRIEEQDAPVKNDNQPVFDFLQQTLVLRRRFLSRRDVTYITLRSWRTPIARYQVQALRALKNNLPEEVPQQIAEEILAEVRSFIGIEAFGAVVPVPCGHERTGACLSESIAAALARKSGLDYVEALATKPRWGASHPKENVKRPPLTLRQEETRPLILIDDVATSGAHLEEAAKLLRPACGSVLAIAWIGGKAR